MAMSSLPAPASTSPSVMRVRDGCVRIMSSARRSSTTPPAILNAARLMPRSLKIHAPASANAVRTRSAVTDARARSRAALDRVVPRHREEERAPPRTGRRRRRSPTPTRAPRLRSSPPDHRGRQDTPSNAARVGPLPRAARRARTPRPRIAHTFRIASSTIRARHLGLADAPVREDDRHLRHAEAAEDRPVGQLDLERVPRAPTDARSIASSTSRRKHLNPPVRSRTRTPEDRPRVEAPAAREDLPSEPQFTVPPPGT